MAIFKNLLKRWGYMIDNNNVFERHIGLLGYRAKDRVTGFSGTIDSVCFDLYGCVQISLRPWMDKDGRLPTGHWFDVTRLEIDTDTRVVEMPNFYEGYVAEGRKGPAEKPSRG